MNASTSALARSDAEARLLAQREFVRPVALEAGAGTGKTATLVARVVAWSLGDGWGRAERALRTAAGAAVGRDEIAARVLGRVVAITFTEAAAAEMAQRAGVAFTLLARGTIPTGVEPACLPSDTHERRLRAEALALGQDRLVVRTIHAFCRRLVASHPIEAGLHPQFEIDADEQRQREIIREVLEDVLARAYGSPGDPDVLALARHGIGPLQLEEALVGALKSALPVSALRSDPFAPERVLGLRERVAGRIDSLRAVEAGRFATVKSSRARMRTLGEALEEIRSALAAVRGGTHAELEALAAAVQGVWSRGLAGHVRKIVADGLNSTETAVFGDDAPALRAALSPLPTLLGHLADLEPTKLALSRRVLLPLLERTHAALRARGVLGFSELLRAASRLVLDHAAVARRIREGIDQLLVDEFQDTDAVQCDLIGALAFGDRAEGRSGLFLVGDPKQSIYGWRSADLGAYERFLGRVEAEGGVIARLCVNYRSAPVLLREVERTIAPVMQARAGVQPRFETLIPCPERESDPGFARASFAPVEHWITWQVDRADGAVSAPSSSAAVEMESRALARDLVALHASGVAWREIAILFRASGDVERYLSALRTAGVPYAVSRDRSYYRRREIIDAAALLRCVLDPNDQLALVTFLRSAAVGVPDAAWLPLWAAHFPALVRELRAPDAPAMAALRDAIASAASAIPDDVPGIERLAGWEASLVAAMEALAVLRRSAECDPADRFVERLRTATLFEATEAARFLGAFRIANLERFFRETAEAMADGRTGEAALLRRLRGAVAEKLAAEEGRPEDAVEDAVQVLSIHKAKGLDFGHVYLMQLHRGSRSDRAPAFAFAERDGGFEYRLFGAPTLGWDRVDADRSVVDAAERIRTLYVAMTRAKHRLVMAGTWPTDGSPRSADLVRTHADLLPRRSSTPDLAARARERALGDGHVVDADGARFVFLGLDPAATREPERPDAREPAGLPSPERVAEDARRLRALATSAARQSARSWSAAASKASHAQMEEHLAAAWFSEGVEPGGAGSTAPAVAAASESEGEASGRTVAIAVGTLLHRVLEEADLAADPAAALAAARDGLAGLVAEAAPELSPVLRERARARADAALERFLSGPLLTRLREIAPNVVARELPVLLAPDPAREDGPVGFVSGAIDLVYRDPASGEWAVVDWKTDAVEGEALEQRARDYLSQLGQYTTAVQRALALEAPPRAELWFLYAGVIRPPPSEDERRSSVRR